MQKKCCRIHTGRMVGLIVVLGLLAGCSLPEANSGIAEAQKLFAQTSADLAPTINPRAAKEVEDAERLLIEQGKEVLVVTGTCDVSPLRSFDPEDRAAQECRLSSLAPTAGTDMSFFEVQLALAAMERYWAALHDLSAAGTRQRVDAASAKLRTELVGLAEALPNGDGSAVQGAAPGAEAFLGFAVDAYRTAQLKRFMTQAEKPIENLTDAITSHLSGLPGGSTEIGDRFRTAARTLAEAETGGNSAGYRDAVVEMRAAHKAVQDYQKNNPSDRLWLVQRAHQDVLKRLQNPTTDDILTTLEEIKEIREVIEGDTP